MILRQTGLKSPEARRQINFQVTAKVHVRLGEMAEEAGVPLSTYARMLFEAAYAARCGVHSEPGLDDQVARVLMLFGLDMDTARIARRVGIPEHRVVRILDAWRQETRGGAA